MAGEPESLEDEIARLRRCLNDLVGITALPALWAGAEPHRVVGTLLDALREMLRLSFVYVRLAGEREGESGLETARVAAPDERTMTAREVGALLDRAMGATPADWPAAARVPFGDADVPIAVARLGLRGEIGVVVAASRRHDFPVQSERLLLDVAANQAVVGLQQARLLHEQRRAAGRLEDALGVSERDSRLIVENIPGMVALLAPTGAVDVANRQLLEYFGQTLEALQHWQMTDVVHPEDLPHVIDVFTRSIAAGTPYEILQRFRRTDGAYRWFQNRGSPVRDPGGRVARWCVLLTDVDERKRAEAAVAASERTLRVTIDTIAAMAWSTGPDGGADFFNQHYLDYIGLSAEQASGWGWTSAVHPEDLPGLASTWEDILRSQQLGEAEARLRHHDGTYRWFLFRANPLRDEAGRVVRWYGINIDIEDRRQAEDALRTSETFLLEVQRLSRTGGWRYDIATDVVESSPEIQRVYAVEPGEDVTRPPFWFDRIHPEERARVRAEFERCMREKNDYQAGYRIVLPDGSIRYQYATGHAVVDDRGTLTGFIGASMDMTEQWRASRELEHASEALRELQTEMSRAAQVATVAELAASIAHEVNQPLSGIITNANTCLRMLAADPPNVDGARETARRALRDGGRAADVIVRLRGLFGKADFAPESLDLNEATREVVALSAADLQRNRVTLELDLAAEPATVMGDRVQLQQVILNLVRNASDAMADVHGRPRALSIRTERTPDDLIRVGVRDTGAGVDPETADKLFTAFHTTKSGGMGIGLSVSRSIVERHRGRLWVEPNAGPGATFLFTIPSGADDGGPAPPDAARPGA